MCKFLIVSALVLLLYQSLDIESTFCERVLVGFFHSILGLCCVGLLGLFHSILGLFSYISLSIKRVRVANVCLAGLHCGVGVEVTELSTNKQHTLSTFCERVPCQALSPESGLRNGWLARAAKRGCKSVEKCSLVLTTS